MARAWYKIKAAAADDPVAEVSIHDQIGGWGGITAQQFIGDLKAAVSGASAVKLTINSPGGDVFDGVAIFNALRNVGKPVNVQVLGIAASIASVIAMAGDTIEMPENAMMMVHNPWMWTAGNAEELREQADVLDKVGDAVATSYQRTGQSAEKIAELLAAETWMSAAEAVELGFADKVTPLVAAKAAFDIADLPEAARKVFEQAAKPVVVAGRPADDAIVAALSEAGLQVYADAFLVDSRITDADSLTAAVQTAREIAALCDRLKLRDEASVLIMGRKTHAEARAHLQAKVVERTAAEIDTRPSSEASTQESTATPTFVDVYAKRAAARGMKTTSEQRK